MSGVVVEDESKFSELIRKVPHIVMTGLSLSCNPFSGCVTSGTWQVFSSFLVQDILFVASATSSIAFAVSAAAVSAAAVPAVFVVSWPMLSWPPPSRACRSFTVVVPENSSVWGHPTG